MALPGKHYDAPPSKDIKVSTVYSVKLENALLFDFQKNQQYKF